MFADFINSEGAHIAAPYRDRFTPSAGLKEPRVTVATWARSYQLIAEEFGLEAPR